jgi:hypothetical protein
MAKPHTTNGQAANPEVHFEHSDVDSGRIVNFGIAFAALVIGSLACSLILFRLVERGEKKKKSTPLPPAAVDSNPLPPKPRLEGIEDVREHNVSLWPPRAALSLAKQEKVLKDGDPQAGILPIDTAIDRLAGKLPARKGKVGAPPKSFSRNLPSSSSSGRPPGGEQ